MPVKKASQSMIIFFLIILSLTSCDLLDVSGGPTIVSSNGFIHFGSIGAQRIIVGEVQNNGNKNLRFITVEATTYTHEGEVHSKSEAYVLVDILLPGEIGPFMFLEATSAEAMTYQLDIVDYKETDVQPSRDFEIIEQQSEINDFDLYAIVGSLTNNSTTTANFLTISATCYDLNGEVVGVGWDTESELDAGATMDFDIWVYPWESADEISSCKLMVDSEVPLR